MVYNAIDFKVRSFVRYCGNSIMGILFFGLILGGAVLTEIYHFNGLIRFIIFSILMVIGVYRPAIVGFIAQSNRINHFISSIEVNQNELSLATVAFTVLLGFIEKYSITLKITNEKIRVRKADSNYGNAKYTGEVFLLIYGTEEFAIAENFFEDYNSLLNEIKKYEEVQNNNEV